MKRVVADNITLMFLYEIYTTRHLHAYTFFEEKKSFMKMDALFVENLILTDDNTW